MALDFSFALHPPLSHLHALDFGPRNSKHRPSVLEGVVGDAVVTWTCAWKPTHPFLAEKGTFYDSPNACEEFVQSRT